MPPRNDASRPMRGAARPSRRRRTPATRPRRSPPCSVSRSKRRGKQARSESSRGSPAKTPVTMGPTRAAAASGPSRRVAKASIVSSSIRPRARPGLAGEAELARGERRPLRRKASGPPGARGGALRGRRIVGGPRRGSRAALFRGPGASTSARVSGASSRKPLGPCSRRKPSGLFRADRASRAARSLEDRHREPPLASAPAAARRWARARPAIPPPTTTTCLTPALSSFPSTSRARASMKRGCELRASVRR